IETGTSAATNEKVSDEFMGTSKTKNTMMPAPMPPMSHQKRPPSKPHVRPLESDAALVSVNRSSLLVVLIFGMVGDIDVLILGSRFHLVRSCRRRPRYWNRGRRF